MRKKFYQITPRGLTRLAQIDALLVNSEDKGMTNERDGWQVTSLFKEGDHVHWRGDYLTREHGLRLRPEIRASFLVEAQLPVGWEPRKRAVPAPLSATFALPDP